MTYTFKLARRLAVSRRFGMLPVLLLFAACSNGDTTAPESPANPPTAGKEWTSRDVIPVAVQINPTNVTLETNQLIHFRAHGRTGAGDSVDAPVVWSTTGGTILPDGRFSAATIGTYQVTGRAAVRSDVTVDTSTIRVVRRQRKLASVEVTPTSANLASGAAQTFQAIGRLPNGDSVAIGVNWSVSGGGIVDAGGTYVAGDTAGTYQVIATNTAGTLADSASITISAPPALPPPTSPPPASLASVTLVPASATIATGATKQFAAYGQSTIGDSVAVSVVFTATGGTVTSTGLYTAGSSAGTFRVIATSGALADTSTVTVTVPLGSGLGSGIPFGPYHVPPDSLGKPSFAYTGGTRVAVPATLKGDLDRVRAAKGRVVVQLLRNYTKDASGKLSVAATRSYLATLPDISSYISDGTVLGIMVSDDITGADIWGGEKPPLARIDSLALLVKTRWPAATTVVRAKPTQLRIEPATGMLYTWRWLQTAWAQYNGPYRDGTPQNYRDANLAGAKALNLGLILGLNVLDGGCGPVSLGACLPNVPGTDILGTFIDAASVRRYQMSAAEVLAYGKVLLPETCIFLDWQWSPIWNGDGRPADQVAGIRAFDTRADVRTSMAALRALAGTLTPPTCRKR